MLVINVFYESMVFCNLVKVVSPMLWPKQSIPFNIGHKGLSPYIWMTMTFPICKLYT